TRKEALNWVKRGLDAQGVEMKLDITNKNTNEIMEIIRKFPTGHVKAGIEDGKARAYWISDDAANAAPLPASGVPPVRHRNPIQKMQDSLFEAFS
ncbi:unnamed protein product, partial [marine sediment metagenome]